MFDDDKNDERPEDAIFDPKVRAVEKSDFFRMHAELAAVFEAPWKFEAEVKPGLDADLARQVQRGIAKLEKAKTPDSPILPPASMPDAAEILDLPATRGVSTNDYHIHRRPGEVMIVRWLAGEQVETFYDRLQAHLDAGLNHFRAEERASNEWKKDPKVLAYLDALDAIEVKMADRYLRPFIRQHNIFVLSTQAADELDILYLCEHIMRVPPAELVGPASAPPEDPTEHDRAWFFKLFSLRGMKDGEERMCFFTYLQKTEDTFDLEG